LGLTVSCLLNSIFTCVGVLLFLIDTIDKYLVNQHALHFEASHNDFPSTSVDYRLDMKWL